jgi:hypothetical protein
MKTDKSTTERYGPHKKQVNSSMGLLEVQSSCIDMGLFVEQVCIGVDCGIVL